MPTTHICLENIRSFDLIHFDVSPDGSHCLVGGKNGMFFVLLINCLVLNYIEFENNSNWKIKERKSLRASKRQTITSICDIKWNPNDSMIYFLIICK